MMTHDSIPARCEPLPWRRIDGRVVIIQSDQGIVHELDPVGSFLWNEASCTKSVAQIIEELTEHFEIDAPSALADAMEFYNTLLIGKLVRASRN